MNCKRGHSPWDHFALGISIFLWRCVWFLSEVTPKRFFDEIRLANEMFRWSHRKSYRFCED